MNQFWILFLAFTVYSFLGWLVESIYCSLHARKWINRGFLNGPFCPVYGFGAVLVVTVLDPFRDNLFLLFLAAVVLTSLLEYLTAVLLEALFHTKYWDYSGLRFNIQGRVCLENSLMFGGLSVLAVDVLQPAFTFLTARAHPLLIPAAGIVLSVYFLLDTALTVNAIYNLNGKLAELQNVLDEIKERAHTATVETVEALQASILVHLDDTTKARLRVLYENKSRLESGLYAIQRRIIRAFPHMESLRSNESLQRVRKALQNRAKKIRYRK
ncbi:MAG: putative ABC transporter permease [Oscillospiraceae bacterium]|jgi:uncharacterized membrane protein|nr:putative ABC transporter permease [Oscillospiraceae bacterium]MCI1989777.1 putative ABC transporter permease [Oscillospiraceae bacterium]MCI2034380.1 putative ABC transporter permease [Oscillospiraceae bacterium]